MKILLNIAIVALASLAAAEECPTIPAEYLLRARSERAIRPIAERRIKMLQGSREKLLGVPLQNIVTGKKLVAPSGDPHDYISAGTYWWPNPDTADGLPYILRDGVTNPDSQTYDNCKIVALSQCVYDLACLYFFTRDEAVAKRGAEQLRSFFLDPATRMNPHLKYGQSVPGVSPGRVYGIIDTYALTNVVNAAALLREAMPEKDYHALQDWFRAYAKWLLEDPMTVPDRDKSQNHGLSYQLQVIAFSRFAEDHETARLHAAKMPDLIVRAIDRNGVLTEEVSRTQSWSYALFTMEMIVNHAGTLKAMGIDLVDSETLCGQRIRKAADFLAGFIERPGDWPYPVLTPVRLDYLGGVMLRMHALTGEKPYLDYYRKLPRPLSDRAGELFFSPSEPLQP